MNFLIVFWHYKMSLNSAGTMVSRAQPPWHHPVSKLASLVRLPVFLKFNLYLQPSLRLFPWISGLLSICMRTRIDVGSNYLLDVSPSGSAPLFSSRSLMSSMLKSTVTYPRDSYTRPETLICCNVIIGLFHQNSSQTIVFNFGSP